MDDEDGSDPERAVRDAIERSRSGAPAVGAVVRDRFSADEVFQRIIAAADEEITSGTRELFFSALAGGFAITITFLLHSSMTATTSDDSVVSALLYPLGFIYIIIGGYQLYTENTLPPVALTLERLASLPALLRHWSIVLAGNFIGGAIGAAALTWGDVFSPDATAAALSHAQHGVETPVTALFFKAVFAGLIVAGVVWIVYAARDTLSRLVVVYLAFLAIPLGNLFHVVVSFTEMMYLVFAGNLGFTVGLTRFIVPVLAGNTLGGIVLVTIVNYFQTTEHRLESARFEGVDRQLSIREWTVGSLAGRSYVSMIDTAEEAVADDAAYRVLVPIGNPRIESGVVDLACLIASERVPATVHAVHIVQTPRASMSYRRDQHERIIAESEELMTDIRETTRSYGVSCETSTIVSHRSFEEIFDTAAREQSNLVVMGWGSDRPWGAGHTDRPLAELTGQLSSDILVLKDRGFDASRVLLPTAGGPPSDLSAEVARALRSTVDSEITLLHVVDGPQEREMGEQFLTDWAVDHDLDDAVQIVDDSSDVEGAIGRVATDHTLILIGASEQGLLSRLVTDSLYFDIIHDVDCSVLLTERPGGRTILERLFGRT
ncbi:formate/nitrite transporter family protein [Halocatena salina]|uniref:Formate/nitrite transporter family protein n=1 Tax=Halocatena salina TaxID=2934340 RepID=A0A8U0ABB3_9EURY|nr:formate/nitrite transporter family protein [Halocatena salina]UPM45173.1 formate/nitrite transporter family protein [Halocatena salina]